MATRKVITKRTQKLLISLLAIIIVATAQWQGWLPASPSSSTTHERTQQGTKEGPYAIDHFIDGDTLAVAIGNKTETIRLIGVDTPETQRPNTPVQCYGPAASAYIKNLIGSQSLRLESDTKNNDRDRYNRLLRYAYLPDGRLVQHELIANGFGFAYTAYPFTKQADFTIAEQAAEVAKKGLWGNCTITEKNGIKQTNAQ